MEDELLLRYSRQILLPEIDVAGQMQLIESSVLLLGLGGLGSVVSMYLAAAGVGNLILVDDDDVELFKQYGSSKTRIPVELIVELGELS